MVSGWGRAQRIAGPQDRCGSEWTGSWQRPNGGCRVHKKCTLAQQGLIPKKDPGEFQLIHNLSALHGASVNEAIDLALCSVKYASLDGALSLLRQLGPGTLMAKADIESAFRPLPVQSDDNHLLGLQFRGKFYYDRCMPMGCSVSCTYFEPFSTFLEWDFAKVSVPCAVIHYLGDFLFLGQSCSDRDARSLAIFKSLMAEFGIPLAQEKMTGPTTEPKLIQ
ncbi:hypothetical protein NDU88_005929 [Pleurodeles waltl]|uniref:ribonuclease H n=1 Tax=Pleurodeles waltl TaxID=8319 RepID=A0AAV7N5R1_PLEWA|nr:hypothetical protein NDU88_005929 [Pleurodeles waltl]